MTPKPLTTEERAECERYGSIEDADFRAVRYIELALAAEAYWREAVKGVENPYNEAGRKVEGTMIKPKPLTTEHLKAIGEAVEDYKSRESLTAIQWQVVDLYGAEAFWREVVRNTTVRQNGDYWMCPVCKTAGSFPIKHEPDCPWVLSQE